MGRDARHLRGIQDRSLYVFIGHPHLLTDVVDKFDGRLNLVLCAIFGIPVWISRRHWRYKSSSACFFTVLLPLIRTPKEFLAHLALYATFRPRRGMSHLLDEHFNPALPCQTRLLAAVWEHMGEFLAVYGTTLVLYRFVQPLSCSFWHVLRVLLVPSLVRPPTFLSPSAPIFIIFTFVLLILLFGGLRGLCSFISLVCWILCIVVGNIGLGNLNCGILGRLNGRLLFVFCFLGVHVKVCLCCRCCRVCLCCHCCRSCWRCWSCWSWWSCCYCSCSCCRAEPAVTAFRCRVGVYIQGTVTADRGVLSQNDSSDCHSRGSLLSYICLLLHMLRLMLCDLAILAPKAIGESSRSEEKSSSKKSRQNRTIDQTELSLRNPALRNHWDFPY